MKESRGECRPEKKKLNVQNEDGSETVEEVTGDSGAHIPSAVRAFA